MKFQRYLYNIQIGQLSVAKYEQDDASITLVAENEGKAESGYAQLDFDDQGSYIDWIDGLVGDRDEVSADAEIVQDVLAVMKSRASQATWDKNYRQKAKKKLVVFNTEKQIEAELLAAIDADDMSFSERCKALLAEHYDLQS